MLIYPLGQSRCLASVTALSQFHNAWRSNVELSCANAQKVETKTLASQSATLLSMTVNIASEVHFNALRSLTQPCLTAYCI